MMGLEDIPHVQKTLCRNRHDRHVWDSGLISCAENELRCPIEACKGCKDFGDFFLALNNDRLNDR